MLSIVSVHRATSSGSLGEQRFKESRPEPVREPELILVVKGLSVSSGDSSDHYSQRPKSEVMGPSVFSFFSFPFLISLHILDKKLPLCPGHCHAKLLNGSTACHPRGGLRSVSEPPCGTLAADKCMILKVLRECTAIRGVMTA